MLSMEKYINQVNDLDGVETKGVVERLVGLVMESRGPVASVGDVCMVEAGYGDIFVDLL